MSPDHAAARDAYEPELLRVDDGGWVARDRSLADDDPRRVIAYLENRDHRVSVVWVRDRRDDRIYNSMAEALDALAHAG